MLKADGARIVITRSNADASVAPFKAEVMALIRSVEEKYWALARAYVQRWVAEQAVKTARDLIDREEAELHCRQVADVAEAKQRLEQFKLGLVTRNSDASKMQGSGQAEDLELFVFDRLGQTLANQGDGLGRPIAGRPLRSGRSRRCDYLAGLMRGWS